MYTLSLQPTFWYIHDRPAKVSSQGILEDYIRSAHASFISQLELLTRFDSSLSNHDERQLKNMLDLLITARSEWEEESQ
jgi:hypothetical protein